MKTKYFAGKLLSIAFAILLCFCTTKVNAQKTVANTPYSFYEDISAGIETYTLAALNNDSLINLPNCNDSLYQFIDSTDSGTIDTVYWSYPCLNFYGIEIDVDLSPNESGTWETLPNDNEVWRLEIDAPTAHGLQFEFSNFQLNPGEYIYLYSPDKTEFYGAFSAANNKSTYRLYTGKTHSNTIIIEYNRKAGALFSGFEIKHVVYIYNSKDCRQTTSSTTDCHNDVNCSDWDSWCNQIRSVVAWDATYLRGDNAGKRFCCSGSLLNNHTNDFAPFLLTAKHCIEDHPFTEGNVGDVDRLLDIDMGSTVFYFNFQHPSCSSSTKGFLGFTLNGSSYRWMDGDYPDTDEALLLLDDVPPLQYNVYYSGIELRRRGNLESFDITTVHHPFGKEKKISAGSLHYNAVTPRGYYAEYSDGSTEGGSSGAPIFNNHNQYVMGQVSGGFANCNNNDRDWFGGLRYFIYDVWKPRTFNLVTGTSPAGEDIIGSGNTSVSTQGGSDPIGSCQQNLNIDNFLLPGELYREAKPEITIQAANTLTVAQNNLTIVSDQNGIPSQYKFIAGKKISILPGSGSDGGFKINAPTINGSYQWGISNTLKLRIEPCVPFQGCGINYSLVAPPKENTNISSNKTPSYNNRQISKDNESATLQVALYPNPANSNLFIISEKNFSFSVKDALGRNVASGVSENGEYSLNVSMLNPGFYFIEIKGDNAGKVLRFIKN